MTVTNFKCGRNIVHKAAKILFVFFITVFTMASSTGGAYARSMSASNRLNDSVVSATSPKCEKKILWYTKGSEVCAPTKTIGIYKWQKSISNSDTTKFMKTCRSYFATPTGQMFCDWVQKYVNNVISLKGPRDNCLTYLENLVNNAVLVGKANKTVTVESAVTPFAKKNSWICHP